MEVPRHRIISLVAISCIVLACIFQTVGVSAVGWVKFHSALGDFNDGMMGLWKACNNRAGCSDIPYVPAWLSAVRAFGILAVLTTTAAVITAVLAIFLTQLKVLSLLPPILAIAAALCELLEASIFGGMAGTRVQQSSKHSLAFCLPLSVIALLLSLAASVLFIVSERVAEVPCRGAGEKPAGKKQTNRPSRLLRLQMTFSSLVRNKI